jgi:alkanesulfonate monooxygenase SsuD/methylene tetrahydromethanopterin reductase-like flavin-dependent oxidoreductase (luciferase family)
MTTFMRLGVTFPQNELSGDPQALHRFAVAAEELGYDHVQLYDHVVGGVRGVERQPPVPERSYHNKDPFHDPLVAFGYLAAVTQRIELVTGMLILPQRQTVLVARQAADVDLLSGGRLRLGVGCAAVCPPQTRPIPIWLGGSSESALRRAAKLADGFIFGYGLRDVAVHAWQQVQQLLREQDRSPDEFPGPVQPPARRTRDMARPDHRRPSTASRRGRDRRCGDQRAKRPAHTRSAH